jgi:hypothetical protein
MLSVIKDLIIKVFLGGGWLTLEKHSLRMIRRVVHYVAICGVGLLG